MKSLLGKKFAQKIGGDATDLPADRLKAEHLRQSSDALVGHSGVPKCADSLAYNPVQRLLAVGCSDGRVKIFGKPGVEQTLLPPQLPGMPTQQLMFLLSRGVMLRVTKDGCIECWSIESADSCRLQPQHILRLASDRVVRIAALASEPFLLLGCASGSVRVATFISASGVAVSEARQVKGLKLLPYRVTLEDLDAAGEVASLSSLAFGRQYYLLALHASSGARVWDIRGTKLAAAVSPEAEGAMTAVKHAGPVTAAAWASGLGKPPEFATGHENGDIFIWALSPDGVQPQLQAVHLLAKRPASAVNRLEFVAGRLSSMLVLGGQASDEPEGLTVVPLSPQALERRSSNSDGDDDAAAAQGDGRQPVKLPWLGNIVGHSMVPSKGSVAGFEEIAAVATLMEEGQLVVHNLGDSKPVPVNISPAFQTLEASQTCVALTSLALAKQAGHGGPVCTLHSLRHVCQQPPVAAEVQLMLEGGQPPVAGLSSEGMAQVVGYADGSVRVWDLSSDAAQLLTSMPGAGSGAALKAGGEKAQGVVCMAFIADIGILVSGHERGAVRVYQYSDHAAKYAMTTLSSVAKATPQDAVQVSEGPGFHLKVISKVHGADISCCALSAASKLVAAADRTGAVSLLDLSKPVVRWLQLAVSQPVVSMALASCALPAPRERSPACTRETQAEGTQIPAVYATGADCTCAVLDAETGCVVGANGWLRPKHASQAVHMALLDAQGQPLWMSQQQPQLGGIPCPQQGASTSSATEGLSPRRSLPPAGSVQQLESAALARQQHHGSEADASSEAGPLSPTPGSPGSQAQEEDDDVEEYLAAAAAQVDAQDKRRNVIGGLIKKVKKKDAQASGITSPDSTEGGSSGQHAEQQAADLHRTSSSASASSSAGAHVPPPPAASPAPRSPPGRPRSPQLPPHPVPTPRPPQRDALPTYMLVCTDSFLRLYSTCRVLSADRTTIKKINLPSPILLAATFHAAGAPGLACLTLRDGDPHLLVYSLPGLQLLSELDLTAAIPWPADLPPADSPAQWAHSIAIGPCGEVVLHTPGKELIRLAVASASSIPARPSSLYDWELAAAAHAAHVALQKALVRTSHGSGSESKARRSGSITERLPDGAGPGRGENHQQQHQQQLQQQQGGGKGKQGAGSSTGGEGSKPRVGAGLQNVFSKVQQGVNLALNETTKGIQQLVQKVDQDLSKLIVRDDRSAQQLPELAVVFAGVVPEEDGTVEAEASSFRGSRTASPAPKAPRATRQEEEAEAEPDPKDDDVEVASLGEDPPTPPARRYVNPGGITRHSSSLQQQSKERAELFGESAAPSTQLKVRTASEIRAAYGRSSATGAGDVGSVMAENRQKLEERAERLRQLNERSAAMEAEAADFASMAKKLAEQQKNRKWWQL